MRAGKDPHSLRKHYPLFYSRFESFLHGNRPRQQSLFTLLGPQANLQERRATEQHQSRLIHCFTDKRHWDPWKAQFKTALFGNVRASYGPLLFVNTENIHTRIYTIQSIFVKMTKTEKETSITTQNQKNTRRAAG